MSGSSRKLSAIVFTDIAGFTELSAQNEPAALALLQAQRQLFAPKVQEFGGQWLKEMGDGLLLSFESTLAAASCAVWMQTLARDVPGLDLRIGIHVGDVVVKGGDVLGDGVNVASRVEPASPIGGIALSPRAQQDLSSQPEFETELIGIASLKGVARPMEVYCIISHGLPGKEHANLNALKGEVKGGKPSWPLAAGIAAAVAGLIAAVVTFWPGGGGAAQNNSGDGASSPGKGNLANTNSGRTGAGTQKSNAVFAPPTNSIVVLPFDNFGKKEEDQGITDGMTELITMHLGKLRQIQVISRTTAMRFRNREADVTEVGRELNVAWVLEGSVQRTGENLRVVAQLIDTRTDKHVWAEEYARPEAEFLDIQSDIAEKIATAFRTEISPAFKAYLARKPTANIELFEEYMRGREEWMKMTRKSLKQAEAIFKEIISKDDKFVLAYVGLAEVFNTRLHLQMDSPKLLGPPAKQNAIKAVELDPELSEAYSALGYVTWSYEWDQNKAEETLLRALALNPNNALAHLHYGVILHKQKWFATAFHHFQKAAELDPLNPQVMVAISQRFKERKQGVEANQIMEDLEERMPDHPFVLMAQANEYLSTRSSRGIAYLNQFKNSDPQHPNNFRLDLRIKRFGIDPREFNYKEDFEEDARLLKAVAMKQYVPSHWAIDYHYNHSQDSNGLAFWLQNGLENHDIRSWAGFFVKQRIRAQNDVNGAGKNSILLTPALTPLVAACEKLLVPPRLAPWVKKQQDQYQLELKKAEAGDAEAQYFVAQYLFFKGWNRTQEEAAQFKTWAKKCAANGNPKGKYLEADVELHLNKNRTRANEIFLESLPGLVKLADAGDARASYLIYWIYREGRGVDADEELAAKYLRDAAENGDVRAQGHLSNILYRGQQGFDRDLDEAKKWATLAALERNWGGMTVLMSLNTKRFNIPIERNDKEALYWVHLLFHGHGNFAGYTNLNAGAFNLTHDERFEVEQRARRALELPLLDSENN